MTPTRNATPIAPDRLRAHPAWRSYLATAIRLDRIARQEGQATLRDRLLEAASRFETLLLRATGRTFCQIAIAASADRAALVTAIGRIDRRVGWRGKAKISQQPGTSSMTQDIESSPRFGTDLASSAVVSSAAAGTAGCRLDAAATWDRACDAVRHGADPRDVARALRCGGFDDAFWRDLRCVATDGAAAGWQVATAPGTVLRAALAMADGDVWWTGPGDSPIHISASSLLALVDSHHALQQAVERLIPAADAHATDADALVEEVADDPNATLDERDARRRHADDVQADIGFARLALRQAEAVRS
jgi:hypothetical protein